ncbi:UNVERIFIED_CONTAM: hypothetical protein K2H54_041935 [Gekko kuhli]
MFKMLKSHKLGESFKSGSVVWEDNSRIHPHPQPVFCDLRIAKENIGLDPTILAELQLGNAIPPEVSLAPPNAALGCRDNGYHNGYHVGTCRRGIGKNFPLPALIHVLAETAVGFNSAFFFLFQNAWL